MEAIPRKAAAVAAAVIVAMAVLGAYQGWQRSNLQEAQTAADGSLLPPTTAVAGARPASALVDPPAAPLTEAQVREIARQEVRATLRGDSASASESPPTTNATAAAATRPATAPGQAPAAPAPPAPAPTPEPAGAAPLF